MKRHSITKSQSSLDLFKGEDTALFVSTLSPNKLKIIQLLDDGYYAAAIARRMGLSRSYCSRFIQSLLHRGFISLEYINPLTRRARSYRVSSSLKDHLVRVKAQTPHAGYTLAIPHKIRYKYPITGKEKPISLTTNRFAAAKLKHVKTWCMIGGLRHIYETKHDHVGRIGIIVHPNSMEVYQRDRHMIIAQTQEEATNIVAMALNETAQRFVQEQAWESVHMELGQPKLVGSVHYAFNSKIAKRVVAAGQSMIQVGNGMEIDESLKAKGIKDLAEIETDDVDEANLVDIGLRNAANIHEIVPQLIREEMRSVSNEILGIGGKVNNINENMNNVMAACQGGMLVDNQFHMLQTIVAKQGESIHLMQQSMMKILENMGKVMDMMAKKT